MTKQEIKDLAGASYNDLELDEVKVSRIVKNLKRSDLREYIKELKRIEKKNTIEIVLPDIKLNKNDLEVDLKKAFPNRKINYTIDPSLMVGIKIIADDLIYDYSLKDTLEKLNNYIINKYD